MVVEKQEIISQTLEILRRKLNEGIQQDKGFEFDMVSDIFRIIENWINHIKDATKPR